MSVLPIPAPLISAGMIGGALGAFMGDVHRRAMALTGRFALTAACLSGHPETARAAGTALRLDPDRIYDDWATMARTEAARPDGIRLAIIVTPNYLHLPVAAIFLDAGIPVFCEKPLTNTLPEAEDFAARFAMSGDRMALAYTYSGYSMVREARTLIRSGRLGPLRSIQAEYLQDWLGASDAPGGWRLDPAKGGPGGCLADIGTHAFHLAEFVTGLRCNALSARVSRLVPGREVPDDAQMQLRFPGGETGGLWVSQVATGCGNGLRLRIFGEKASLEWAQERPEDLILSFPDGHSERIVRGATGVTAPSLLPRGHPEGYLEAFARLYTDLADRIEGRPAPLLPTLADGLRGQHFVAAALTSGAADGAWISLTP
ncbi:Gfo/Idh/MocA family protein [Acetobacter musti]|nr:Gfo/Idh/MocA family oxidoreductase [Acetobacter musti]